jgi:hypothetical protein
MVERLLPSPPDMGASPARRGGAAERGAGIVVGPEPWVKGGRSPAQRTLEARGRAITLAHGRMRRGCASGHESQSGARRGTQAAIDPGFEHQDQVVPLALECGQKRLRGAEHFLAMVDRSDQAQQNAGPRISIKKVYRINLAGATDVRGITLKNENDEYNTCAGLNVTKSATPFLDLGANTLAEVGNRVPEKWEGLAIGPQISAGIYLLLAGTDNDYSVTQNGSGTQFDVYFNFAAAVANPAYDAYANSIQCPMGQVTGCFATSGGAPASLTLDHTQAPARRAARLQGDGKRPQRLRSAHRPLKPT